jgi:hypothetical protein
MDLPTLFLTLKDRRIRRSVLAGAVLVLGAVSMRETAHHFGLVSAGLVLGAAIASYWD